MTVNGVSVYTPMKLDELIQLIDGKVLTDAPLTGEIKGGCGADLMSDVLASIQPDAVLFTGLCNPQVVRTAQMADVTAIVFVRGKRPDEETVGLAEESGLPVMVTDLLLYEACGRLYARGLAGCGQG